MAMCACMDEGLDSVKQKRKKSKGSKRTSHSALRTSAEGMDCGPK